MYTDVEKSFYLYLTLDPHSMVELPFDEQRKAFCAGYVVALSHSWDYDNKIVHMGLGTSAQIERIISDIQKGSYSDYNPHDPYYATASGVKGKYGARCVGEYNDADPITVTPLDLKKAFISGYQAAQYAKHEREIPPIDVYTPLALDRREHVKAIEDLAIGPLTSLSEVG